MTAFRLVYGDYELALPLSFDPHAEELLRGLISRAEPGSPGHAEVSKKIVDTLTAMVEGNALPPTERQMKYALAICKELGLQLPAEAIQHRDSMAVFLGIHAAEFKRRRGVFTALERP